MNNKNLASFSVPFNTTTLFLFSTSGSQSSIEKHNKALHSLSANLTYFTFPHKISAKEYANLLKSPITRGGAVTGQGLKSEIIPFLDETEALAQNTGAVNTVVNRNGKLYGYNTDAFGFETAVKKHIKESGLEINNAVIYGNGGVSGVASYVLKNMGINVTMRGRNQDKVNKKMKELKLTDFSGPFDLVVNATPMSSYQLSEVAGFLEILDGSKMVFDHNMPEKDNKINYLEQFCLKTNTHFIPGKEMYVPQMIKQWKLFMDGVQDISGNALEISEDDIKRHWNV
ncbi:shikimate dehydrogenase family protein [Flammeovirga kamogawensis]|uniref:Shikimate dehydrogenase n=1 Tax=Flammeovirga kamogawensis TaxID=373891 RepID=A0ABX8GVL4_9BACT|nr:shikimate dehydrogenase [Flammeovirga kamogawensis]MBB6460984.1 shikimate dehydrogenase [Flammeovirga kamogawensis]QWG07556.1 shikimate dehydrogenase [Flammeovirga kamogawensis]TRX69368.1 shikimate dehydrogenase [Flammeovirga kamogawensis]